MAHVPSDRPTWGAGIAADHCTAAGIAGRVGRVDRFFARWDQRNQEALEEDNRWLSGDDWANGSAGLRRLRMIRFATTKTIRFAALFAVLVGVRIAVGVGDWRRRSGRWSVLRSSSSLAVGPEWAVAQATRA